MPVYDSTGTLDASMFLKAKLAKNMVGDNYYIKNLQDIRNRDWYARYNVVDIEQEFDKQTNYTKLEPNYTPIEVAIRTVKSEKGIDLGSDWADIAFRDLKHPNHIGSRFRFSTEFPDLLQMTEEEKHFNTSIWVAVNKNPVSSGNNCIIRRCNSTIALVGSPTLSYEDITEVHYEPVVLENDLKYINMYYNMTVDIPQSEWYATMQLNYFSNCIKVNDRVIFGGVDLIDRDNNAVYKVKAVVKANALNTYQRDGSAELEKIPLCVVAFDKDVIDKENDKFEVRIAARSPIYSVGDYVPVNEYYIALSGLNADEPYVDRILLGQTESYKCNLVLNDKIVQGHNVFNITAQLVKEQVEVDENYIETGEIIITPVENEEDYYEFEIIGDNKFSIKNKKACNFGVLKVICKSTVPNGTQIISAEYNIQLGGFY